MGMKVQMDTPSPNNHPRHPSLRYPLRPSFKVSKQEQLLSLGEGGTIVNASFASDVSPPEP